MNNVKPWANGPLELLRHAEGHLRANSDFDRRMALISFDNSIETSITTYLQLHPAQRGGRAYERRDVERWSMNYHTKLEFLEEHVSQLKQPVRVTRDEIIWYHQLRNEIYHAGNGLVPEERSIDGIRRAALWAFSVLFGVEAEDLVTAESASPPEPVREIQQDRLSGSMALVESYIKFERTLEWSKEAAGLGPPGKEPPDLLRRWDQVAGVIGSIPTNYTTHVHRAREARNAIVEGRATNLTEGELRDLASGLDQVSRFLERRFSRASAKPVRAAARTDHPLEVALQQVERDIGIEATQRLREHLDRCRQLDIKVHKRSASFSFRVWSWRRTGRDQPPKRALITVFSFNPDPGDPSLFFPALHHWTWVLDLQIDPLVNRLRDLGCTECKWNGLRFYLNDLNSADAFDQLYGITRDMVREVKETLRVHSR